MKSKAIYLIILVVLGYIILKFFQNSLFFTKKDRINIAFYSDKPVFMSLGLSDNIHYNSTLNNDWKILVPGGYGYYKVGAIGKLAQLQKDVDLVSRAFSSAYSNKVDYYFVSSKDDIYIDLIKNNDDDVIGDLNFFKNIFFGGYITNANFLDKIYIFFSLAPKRRSDFSRVDLSVCLDKDGVVKEDVCMKKYQGYFYQKYLREEDKTIQIYYQSYSSATMLSRILEGEGVSVVDYTQVSTNGAKCEVLENTPEHSATAKFLSQYFGCNLKVADVDIADIRFILGTDLEKKWSIN